jgi:hypothetical protein
MSSDNKLIPPFTLSISNSEETHSETGLDIEPITNVDAHSAPQSQEQGTRIVEAEAPPVPSLFDSATVIKPSMYAETVIHSLRVVPPEPPKESRRKQKAEKKVDIPQSTAAPSLNLKRLYYFLNDLTSLSHWKGRLVWLSATGLLIFMIILNNNTTEVVPPRSAKPMRITQTLVPDQSPTPAPPPLKPVQSQTLASQTPVEAKVEPQAKVQMKSEFLVRLHELIDKSRSYAP